MWQGLAPPPHGSAAAGAGGLVGRPLLGDLDGAVRALDGLTAAVLNEGGGYIEIS